MRCIYGSKPRDCECSKIHKNQIEWREKNVLRNLCRMICAGLAICEQILMFYWHIPCQEAAKTTSRELFNRYFIHLIFYQLIISLIREADELAKTRALLSFKRELFL